MPTLKYVYALLALACSLPLIALSQSSTDQLDVAEYEADGRLVFPPDTDRWILLGTGLGGDYNEAAFDPANPGSINVVQIEPSAYEYFLANGSYADGSMLLLTFFGTQQKPEPRLNGFVQQDMRMREIHVIDRQRFSEEGRGFFVFQTDNPAVVMPLGSECVECHTEHATFDGTFTQFYPTIRHLVTE